jgi:hypothetical protein
MIRWNVHNPLESSLHQDILDGVSSIYWEEHPSIHISKTIQPYIVNWMLDTHRVFRSFCFSFVLIRIENRQKKWVKRLKSYILLNQWGCIQIIDGDRGYNCASESGCVNECGNILEMARWRVIVSVAEVVYLYAVVLLLCTFGHGIRHITVTKNFRNLIRERKYEYCSFRGYLWTNATLHALYTCKNHI